jgi:hypothetical protein
MSEPEEKSNKEKLEEIKKKWFGEEDAGTVTRGWDPDKKEEK